MPDRLPRLTFRDFRSVLVRDGWFILREAKRHSIYAHPSKRGLVPVGRHLAQAIKRGTLDAMLKQAGLTRDDLRRLL